MNAHDNQALKEDVRDEQFIQCTSLSRQPINLGFASWFPLAFVAIAVNAIAADYPKDVLSEDAGVLKKALYEAVNRYYSPSEMPSIEEASVIERRAATYEVVADVSHGSSSGVKLSSHLCLLFHKTYVLGKTEIRLDKDGIIECTRPPKEYHSTTLHQLAGTSPIKQIYPTLPQNWQPTPRRAFKTSLGDKLIIAQSPSCLWDCYFYTYWAIAQWALDYENKGHKYPSHMQTQTAAQAIGERCAKECVSPLNGCGKLKELRYQCMEEGKFQWASIVECETHAMHVVNFCCQHGSINNKICEYSQKGVYAFKEKVRLFL